MTGHLVTTMGGLRIPQLVLCADVCFVHCATTLTVQTIAGLCLELDLDGDLHLK